MKTVHLILVVSALHCISCGESESPQRGHGKAQPRDSVERVEYIDATGKRTSDVTDLADGKANWQIADDVEIPAKGYLLINKSMSLQSSGKKEEGIKIISDLCVDETVTEGIRTMAKQVC